jgi:hypothetical protein
MEENIFEAATADTVGAATETDEVSPGAASSSSADAAAAWYQSAISVPFVRQFPSNR